MNSPSSLPARGMRLCAPAEKNPPWFRIDPGSEIKLEAQPLALASELGALPQPFLEHWPIHRWCCPLSLFHTPDAATLESAGVLASWFGSLADDSGVRYYTQLGELPTGNAIVFLVGTEAAGRDAGPPQTSVSLQANPIDPYGKLLLIHGQTSDDLLAVSQALSTGQLKMAGSSAYVSGPTPAPVRAPNDAPRWIHTDRVSLASLASPGGAPHNGQNPFNDLHASGAGLQLRRAAKSVSPPGVFGGLGGSGPVLQHRRQPEWSWDWAACRWWRRGRNTAWTFRWSMRRRPFMPIRYRYSSISYLRAPTPAPPVDGQAGPDPRFVLP